MKVFVAEKSKVAINMELVTHVIHSGGVSIYFATDSSGLGQSCYQLSGEDAEEFWAAFTALKNT